MPDPSSFNDCGPITWVKRTPVYLTTILTAVFVAGLLMTVALVTARLDWHVLTFSPPAFWRHAALWQLVTYPLIAMPSLMLAFNLYFFFRFGTDVERYIGRGHYIQLLVIFTLLPAVLQSLWWALSDEWRPWMGSQEITFGFFIACVTLYPNAEFFNIIALKWLATILVGITAMIYLMERDWQGLSNLLAATGAGCGYIKFIQHGGSFEIPAAIKNIFKRRPKFKVVPRNEGDDVHDSIDPLLDKISKHGISSLTAKEREQLQRARESLLKKPE